MKPFSIPSFFKFNILLATIDSKFYKRPTKYSDVGVNCIFVKGICFPIALNIAAFLYPK